ncbi:MAG TPA: GNAT family N-acetyltransferase [Candidatus Baltobacteraceae bacterium]
MAGVIVRPAVADDRAFIEDLGRRTVLASLSAVRVAPAPLLEASFERLLQIVTGRSYVGLIAQDGPTRVGFALMLDTLPDEVTGLEQGFIAYMAVEPARRREGAGAALLKAAEDEARKRGLPHVSLMVTQANAAARALYERAGYVTERRLLCKQL